MINPIFSFCDTFVVLYIDNFPSSSASSPPRIVPQVYSELYMRFCKSTCKLLGLRCGAPKERKYLKYTSSSGYPHWNYQFCKLASWKIYLTHDKTIDAVSEFNLLRSSNPGRLPFSQPFHMHVSSFSPNFFLRFSNPHSSHSQPQSNCQA